MFENKATVTACLVVYNEGAVIERCLESIKKIVDEIIIVHDGQCSDKTLEIASRYTNKIFIRDHVGMMEAHLVFAFEQATGEWLLRIDADEFFDIETGSKIIELVKADDVSGYIFKWEMWNGEKTVSFPGLQKMCLVRRSKFHYLGIPHENGRVDGEVCKLDLYLRHRPVCSNVSWKMFMQKTRKWVPIHAEYFFYKKNKFDSFNEDPDVWLVEADKVRNKIWYYFMFMPFKMSLGQLKNGLWKSRYGIRVSVQRFVYYVMLYWIIMKRVYFGKQSD